MNQFNIPTLSIVLINSTTFVVETPQKPKHNACTTTKKNYISQLSINLIDETTYDMYIPTAPKSKDSQEALTF